MELVLTSEGEFRSGSRSRGHSLRFLYLWMTPGLSVSAVSLDTRKENLILNFGQRVSENEQTKNHVFQ